MKRKLLFRLSTAILMSTLALAPVSNVFAQTYHTVSKGEWLWGIARQYGVTAGDIMAANGLSSEWIDEGWVLYIPAPGSGAISNPNDNYTGAASGVHVVAPGETIYGIASTYGLTEAQLMAWNGLSSSWIDVGDQLILYGEANVTVPTPSVPTTPAPSNNGNYRIQPGDTISGIAFAHGISVSELMAANGLTSDWLIAGNSLYIPRGGQVYDPSPTTNGWSGLPSANAVNGAHIVQSGDTLSGIALVYGVSEADLWYWNGLSSDWLNVGDVIYVVPTSGPVSTPVEAPLTMEPTEPVNQPVDKPIDRPIDKPIDKPVKDKEKDNKDKPQGPENTKLKVNGIRVSDLPEKARPDIHRVKAGDTMESIADQYKIKVENLKKWNKVYDEDGELEEGRDLFVSNPGLVPTIHKVAKDESLYDIATEYETTEQWLMEWNELENTEVEVDSLLIVSDPKPRTHEIEPGETLQDIAELYQIKIEDLREWNEIPERVSIVNGVIIVSDPREGYEEEADENTDQVESESSVEENANPELQEMESEE